MNGDELIDSWDRLVAYVDQQVRPTIMTVVTIDDTYHRGQWRSDVIYEPNDSVEHSNTLFIAIKESYGVVPHEFGTMDWMLLRKPESVPRIVSAIDNPGYMKDFQNRVSELAHERLSYSILRPLDSVKITSGF